VRPLFSGVRHVASALPFLLLGPLSEMGYLKTLAATMDAANASNLLPLFATALAYKVLAPPARGWRRDATMVDAAKAFAAPVAFDQRSGVYLHRRLLRLVISLRI